MSIDTSRTSGKILLMTAELEGKEIQVEYFHNKGLWCKVLQPTWDWRRANYRIKPQTVKEAAAEIVKKVNSNVPDLYCGVSYREGFIKGAQWQKEQDNE